MSIGQTGNDRIASYQYLQSYSFGGNYVFGTSDASGIYANTMPNPNITWEKVLNLIWFRRFFVEWTIGYGTDVIQRETNRYSCRS